eukprot:769039-Rhodomonas_salina.1
MSLSLPKECCCQCQARSTLCVHELYFDGGAPFGATDTQEVERFPRHTLSQELSGTIPFFQHWQSQKRTGKTKESSPTGQESDYGQTPTR